MKLPTDVEIMGRKIPVRYISKPEMEKIYPNAIGVWESTLRTIFILKDTTDEEKLYTLYHEMGHALKSFVGLDQVIAHELQEVIVQSYATLIEDILNQSQKLKLKSTRRKKV